MTFEAITRRRVISDQWSPGANADIEHISLATDIALLVIAPATANVIGKLANGIADDFLTSLYLATRAPVLIAPAMNSNMLAHDAVQRNLDTLAARGVRFVEPGEGYLACGWIGKGRLAEPDDVVAAAEQAASARPVVVAAGVWSLRPAPPTKTSIPFASSAIDPAAAWDTRSLPKQRSGRRRRAHYGADLAGRSRCLDAIRVRTRRGDARGGALEPAGRRRARDGGGGGELHGRARRRAKKSRTKTRTSSLTLVPTRDILADAARGAATADSSGRCSSVCRRDAGRHRTGAREASAEGHRPHRRQRRVAR